MLDLKVDRSALHAALTALKKGGEEELSLLQMLKETPRRKNEVRREELGRWLRAMGPGLTERATRRIADEIFTGQGDTVPIDHLVSVLVPIDRVERFEQLTEAEISMMRRQFATLHGGRGTIDAAQLDAAAAKLPGLHKGALSAADRAAIAESVEGCGGQVDLATLFDLFRRQRRKAIAKPDQLLKVRMRRRVRTDRRLVGGPVTH